MPIYLGKLIPKENFRAFIYSPTEEQKLVESWHEFEVHMQTGIWFATQNEADEIKDQKSKKNKKTELDEMIEMEEIKKDKK